MTPVRCPHCGSYRTAREHGPGEWVWLVAAAATFFMRWLLTMARYREYRGEPGLYRCGDCGRTFTYFL